MPWYLELQIIQIHWWRTCNCRPHVVRASIILNHRNLAIQVKLSDWYNELIERFGSLNDLRTCIVNCWAIVWLIIRIVLFTRLKTNVMCRTSIRIWDWLILLIYKLLHGIIGHHIHKCSIASLEFVDLHPVLIKSTCIDPLLMAVQLMLRYFLRLYLMSILWSRCEQNNIIAISLNAALVWQAIGGGGIIVI